MAFEKKVPQWYAPGAEPPESLKTSGFQGGYQPPADFFNWFWHGVSEALNELQENGFHKEDVLPIVNGGTGANTPAGAVDNLLVRTLITADNLVDANTLAATGIYRCYFEDTSFDPEILNLPARYGTMFVFGATSYRMQLFIDVGSYRLYYRSTSNGGSTWGTWRRIVTLTEMEDAMVDKAESTHKHDAADITSGALPIAHGGTGASSTSAAVSNLLVKTLIDHNNPVDANTITAIGVYRAYFEDTSFDPTTLHYPARYVDMFVFGTSSYVVQVAVDMAASRMYFRSTSNSGNTWSAWQRHATLNSSGVVGISSGGTGATNAADALANLGIKASTTDLTAGTSTLATGEVYLVYE